MIAAVRIDPETGLKIFNTRAAKASEKITGKGYSVLADQKLKELPERHFHAARQWWAHRVYAGNKFGDDQRRFPSLVERLGGAQDAGLGIGRDFAKKSEQRPSRGSAGKKEQRVAEQHGRESEQHQDGSM